MSLNPIKTEEIQFIQKIVIMAIKKAGSSKKLAEHIGLAPARITEYKSGKVMMNAGTFVKLINYLNLSIINEKKEKIIL